MNPRSIVLLVAWGVLLCIAAADIAYHFPQMPERVASHFNAAGEADQWTSSQAFLTMWIVVLVALSLVFAGLRLAIPYLPARFINVPNRERWLAPDRAPYTRAVIGELILWFGLVMLATMSGLNHITMRANLSPAPNLGVWPWVILGANLLAALCLIVVFTRRFGRQA